MDIITKITEFVQKCVKFFQDLIAKIRSGEIVGGEKETTGDASDIVA